MLIILVIVVAYALFKNQSFKDLSNRQPIPQWKTYENTQMGFSMKYPQNWVLEIVDHEENVVIFSDPQKASEEVTIAVTTPDMEKVIRRSVSIAKETKITIDGKVGARIASSDSRDKNLANLILVVANGKLYYLAGSSTRFDAIAGTLKFH